MPKTKNDSWLTYQVPETPLQRGVFIDKCTEWLVRSENANEVSETSFPSSQRTRHVSEVSTKPHSTMGLNTRDLKLHESQACFLCSSTSGVSAVISNPFSHMDIVLVCDCCLKA